MKCSECGKVDKAEEIWMSSATVPVRCVDCRLGNISCKESLDNSNGWISVRDRLPENNEYVLACDDRDIYLLKFIQITDKRHKIRSGYFDSSDENFHDELKYWMPLPESPIKRSRE